MWSPASLFQSISEIIKVIIKVALYSVIDVSVEEPTISPCFYFTVNSDAYLFNPMHSEWSKLYGVLAFLSAIGVKQA